MRANGLHLRIPYWLLLLLVFMFGINVPRFSQIVVYLLALPLILSWRGATRRDFLIPVALLFAFGVTYYVLLYGWGFIGLGQAVHRPLMFIGFYAVGYSATRTTVRSWPYGLTWLLIAMVSGFVIFTFLSTILTPVAVTLSARAVNNFWGSGEQILVTGVGIFASLGLCLLPVAIFGAASSSRDPHYVIVSTVTALLFMLAFYATSLFQTRSGLIALAITIGVALALFLSRRNSRPTFKILALVAIGAVIIIAALNVDRILASRILTRLSDRGLETPRYRTWLSVITNLPTHLLGGRSIDLLGLDFAHDLWLDVGVDAGVAPLALLVAFHAVHIRDFRRVVTSRLPFPVTVTFACLGISFLVGFMVEPALQSSAPYFAASCFLLGMTRRLSWDVTHSAVAGAARIHATPGVPELAA